MKIVALILPAVWSLEIDSQWTAQEKDEYVWSKVQADGDDSAWWWSPFKMGLTVFNDMTLPFEQTDFMQRAWYTFGLAPRPKTVHTVGVVQQIKFEPTAAGQAAYSGIFSSGADYGIARYSTGI